MSDLESLHVRAAAAVAALGLQIAQVANLSMTLNDDQSIRALLDAHHGLLTALKEVMIHVENTPPDWTIRVIIELEAYLVAQQEN